MPWQITIDGRTFREGDLTIGQAEQIDKQLDDLWVVLHPVKTPKRLAGLIAWLIAAETGEPFAETLDKVLTRKTTELFDAVGVEQPDLPTEFENGFPQ